MSKVNRETSGHAAEQGDVAPRTKMTQLQSEDVAGRLGGVNGPERLTSGSSNVAVTTNDIFEHVASVQRNPSFQPNEKKLKAIAQPSTPRNRQILPTNTSTAPKWPPPQSESNPSVLEQNESTAHKSKSHASIIRRRTLNPIGAARDAAKNLRGTTAFDDEQDKAKQGDTEAGGETFAKLNPVKSKSDFDDTTERLQDQLAGALKKSSFAHHRDFIPQGELNRLITLSAVENELLKQEDSLLQKVRVWKDKTDLRLRARTICGAPSVVNTGKVGTRPKEYRKIFAILLLIDRPHRIKSFLKAGISDDDLPLLNNRQATSKIHPKTSSKDLLQFFKSWRTSTITRFEERQWTVIAPTFNCPTNERAIHHELHQRDVLPFTSWKRVGQQGGFGLVYRAEIHHDHHTFDQQGGVFAVKSLFKSNKEAFQREVRILNSLSNERHRHEHLINLLATFEQSEKYYLLLPLAKADLVAYWKHENPIPSKDQDTAFWLAKQCHGLAEALYKIHHWETFSANGLIHPDSIPRYAKIQQRESSGSMSNPGKLFGRHGDIKPNNILWFYDGGRGTLKITDFGIAQFSTRDSVPAHSREPIANSPMYRAPENDLPDWMLSPSFDIWALACVYVEFITWFFGGWEGVDTFAHERLAVDPNYHNFKTITFFTLEIGEGSTVPRAKVKDSVTHWMEYLRSEASNFPISVYADFFQKFLLMIQRDMLIVEHKSSNGQKIGRKCARKVAEMISGMLPPLEMGDGSMEIDD